MKDRVRVLVVDDHPATRQGISTFLQDAGISVIGQVDQAEQVVAQAASLKPDVILLDVRMKHRSGLWALEQIREKLPGQRVVMLSAFDDSIYLARSAALKANDFLLKDVSPTVLAATIRRVVHDDPIPEDSLLRRVRRPTSYRQLVE
jgi:DNA-binding NarL/FixJ family response regulator